MIEIGIAERMKQRRKELRLSADEVAKKVGVSRSNIYRYEKGDIENLPLEILEPLSKALKTTPEFLMGWETSDDILPIYKQLNEFNQKEVYSFAEQKLEEQNKLHTIEVVGKTAAGEPVTYGDGDTEEKQVKHVPEGADCALNVQGDSMEPDIKDGSIIFYKAQPEVEHGEIAVVEIDGHEVTTKRIKYDYDNKKIILESLNDKYEDRRIFLRVIRNKSPDIKSADDKGFLRKVDS